MPADSTPNAVNMGSIARICTAKAGDGPRSPRMAKPIVTSEDDGLKAIADRRAYLPDSNSTSVVPSAAGLGDTRMPAAFIASILLSAPPLPPEMIAPA